MKSSSIFNKLTNVKQFNDRSVQVNNISLRDKKNLNFDIESVPLSEEKIKAFDNINTKELQRNIAAYKSIDLKTVTEEELNHAASKILTENLVNSLYLDEGVEFYRARNKIFTLNGAEDLYRNVDEVWYPDAKFLTKLGRLNNIGQQIMYASMDALTPIHEIRSVNDSQFALMKYKVKKGCRVKLTTVAFYSHDKLAKDLEDKFDWTAKGLQNWQIINEFLSSEFTKKVPSGQEYMYKSTNGLLKFIDFPTSEGFLYPSIERDGGYNIALKTQSADDKIEFVGLAYFKNLYYDKKEVVDNDFTCFRKWSTTIDRGKIIYNPISTCTINFLGVGDGKLIDEVYHANDVVPSTRISDTKNQGLENKKIKAQKKKKRIKKRTK